MAVENNFKDGHVWLNHRQTFVLMGKIEFDNKYEKISTSFGINPLRKAGIIAKKPNNLDAKTIQQMKNFDEPILKIVTTTGYPSYRRNIIPMTENQKIGWDEPAMRHDKSHKASHMMLHYGRTRKLFYK